MISNLTHLQDRQLLWMDTDSVLNPSLSPTYALYYSRYYTLFCVLRRIIMTNRHPAQLPTQKLSYPRFFLAMTHLLLGLYTKLFTLTVSVQINRENSGVFLKHKRGDTHSESGETESSCDIFVSVF